MALVAAVPGGAGSVEGEERRSLYGGGGASRGRIVILRKGVFGCVRIRFHGGGGGLGGTTSHTLLLLLRLQHN